MTADATPNDSALPPTYFAPPERATPEQIHGLAVRISNNPLLDAVMRTLGGWVCVTNSCRQILAVNHAWLEALGIADPAAILGFRPGEVLNCVHAHDHPAGCGTSRYCSTCGAAVAIVAAQDSGNPKQLECQITFEKNGLRGDREFVVSCTPFQLDGEDLLLICMRDISEEKRRIVLERMFLHDASNLLTALAMGAAALPTPASPADAESIAIIREAAGLLIREIRIQRLLTQNRPISYPVEITRTTARAMLEQVKTFAASQSAGRSQSIVVQTPKKKIGLETDVLLLNRVLANMATNAFEAGRPGDEVRLSARARGDAVEFAVWNRQSMPETVAMRVFHRYFTTKPDGGRGLGTYIMKLLGEQLLGGQVSFTSTPADGTTFRLLLPRRPALVSSSIAVV